jgi:hypothetical protein
MVRETTVDDCPTNYQNHGAAHDARTELVIEAGMETDTGSSLGVRVMHGAKWLDTYVPDWYWRIFGRLAMENPCMCVLGYVFGGYFNVVPNILAPDDAPPPSAPFTLTADEAEQYGFSLGLRDDDMWEELSTAWEAVIHARVLSDSL